MDLYEYYEECDYISHPSASVIINDAIAALKENEISFNDKGLSLAEVALLTAEAINLAAKVIDADFYNLKPSVIDAAMELGCIGGWNGDVFYMEVENGHVGVVSFHDPYSQITSNGYWPHGWSGIKRQDMAFELLINPTVRRVYSEATSASGCIYGVSNSAVNNILRKLKCLN